MLESTRKYGSVRLVLHKLGAAVPELVSSEVTSSANTNAKLSERIEGERATMRLIVNS